MTSREILWLLEEIHRASEVNIYLNVLKTWLRKVLMMLTVSMPVSHLYQNLKIVKGVRNLKQASEVVNYYDKRAKSICRRHTIIQLFKQKFGTAMGSPVSPILANFFMEWLQQQAIATARYTEWFRRNSLLQRMYGLFTFCHPAIRSFRWLIFPSILLLIS